MDRKELEDLLLQYLDHVKVLISAETWENIVLDCTKNELLILMLLYQKQHVNMTQIAEFINVPLNTATGVVARMEKRKMLRRERSVEDKRVVTITLDDYGRAQINDIIGEFMYYAGLVMDAFTAEEMAVLKKLMDKMMEVLKNERYHLSEKKAKTIKRITIE